MKKRILLFFIAIPFLFIWLWNGGTFFTISQQDWFYKGNSSCITNNCLESISNFNVNPYEEDTYIIPLILNKIEYKEPYSFWYSVNHHEQQDVQDFFIEFKTGELVVEKRKISPSELHKEVGETAFHIGDIPFNSDKHDTLDVYIEYVISGQKEKQIDKIQYKVEIREDFGMRFWWTMMSV